MTNDAQRREWVAKARPRTRQPTNPATPMMVDGTVGGIQAIGVTAPDSGGCHIRVAYRADARQEPPALEGIFALTADCLADVMRAELEQEISLEPGYFGPEVTLYVSRQGAKQTLQSVARIMLAFERAPFNANHLENAQARREIRSRGMEVQIRAMVQELIFTPTSRARIPSDGPGARLSEVTLQEVRDHSVGRLVTRNAALIVSGDDAGALVTPASDFDRTFAAPAGAYTSPTPLPQKIILGQSAVVDVPDSKQCRLVLAHQVPGPGSPEWRSLKWLETYLASGMPGSLGAVLRTDNALSYGASARLAEFGSEAAWVFTFASPIEQSGEAIALARQTIGHAGTNLQDPETMLEVGRMISGRDARSAASSAAIARATSQNFLRHSEPKALDQQRRIPPTGNEVARVAAEWLHADQLNLLVAGPLARI